MEFPTNIGDLIHLRYFSFYSSYRIPVPPSIGNLFNLQTLKFLGAISKLPNEIGKLINLRHLQLSNGCSEGYPKSIANLTSLQTLENVYFHSTILTNNNMACLQDLRGLNNLRKLGLVNLGCEEDKEKAKEAELHNKTKLAHLYLLFDVFILPEMETHETVLETLRPHISLKSLRIVNYRGRSISPSWMVSLINLRSLYLDHCHYHDTLPPLGKLPCLESLDIYSSDGLKKMGPEFLGVEIHSNTSTNSLFPKLKQLNIRRAKSLEEWVGVVGWNMNDPLKIMPCLESLDISFCQMLRTLPDFLEATPLKNLNIFCCKHLAKSCLRETGNDWPKIRHVPNITISTRTRTR
ncbi:putative disease resistance protein RGA3 [Humulus lupulus]|uniref:putative disease resistance protein RGA3 n=1 Tax=Humulus lupulus TaxID=3486 RepID=UPI002B404E29|nr:putative disease resistance protein RGA3 [Humulus lupulus]